MASPPPPPPFLKPGNSPCSGEGVHAGGSVFPFTTTGNDASDLVFEFPDLCTTTTTKTTLKPVENSSILPLRRVVSQYIGSIRAVPVSRLFDQLGRLRALHHLLEECRTALIKDKDQDDSLLNDDTQLLKMYWRRRAMDHLTVFGVRLDMNSEDDLPRIPGLKELIDRIEQAYTSDIDQAHQLRQSSLVYFGALGELYRPGCYVSGATGLGGGLRAGFRVLETYYDEHRSLVGPVKTFHMTLEYAAAMGAHFGIVRFEETLSAWMGSRNRPISDLPYRPLDDTEHLTFEDRGMQSLSLGASGVQFLEYRPSSFYPFGNGRRHTSSASRMASRAGTSVPLQTGGRIVLDIERSLALGYYPSQGAEEATNALLQAAGRYRRWWQEQSLKSSTTCTAKDSIPPDNLAFVVAVVPRPFLACCWPAFVGFSFTAKTWGIALVDGLGPIAFNNQAFDQLVLAPERKRLIKALVTFGSNDTSDHNQNQPSVSDDIIGGKSGGSIFLLHGPPGVGKTLTAEAIAEVLHRPLYYVTMGELGTTPEEMETRLTDVLDLCSSWNALTLIDEADVFLETRRTSDVLRNAMVCVMLRLIEYHRGILFLTTNRVEEFDPAFESRVTVALRYSHLDPPARIQIWQNLIQRLPESLVDSELDVSPLGCHVLNGRQIKNAVRLATALAQDGKEKVTLSLLEETVSFMALGRQDMRVGTYEK